MKIKVCGLRDPGNIEELLALPIDYIGFIFYGRSPRHAPGPALEKWAAAQSGRSNGVERVGVFVNAEIEMIINAVHDYHLDWVQLHGDEEPEYCREMLSFWDASSVRRARLIKAFAIDKSFDFAATETFAPFCPLFLFDTKSLVYGGSGRRFDWSLLTAYQGLTPFLLSGGIDPAAAEDIARFQHSRLHGIDLNSRFETAPGVKDVPQIASFIRSLSQALTNA
jgi:phosphoribosylanthranilate isomerase